MLVMEGEGNSKKTAGMDSGGLFNRYQNKGMPVYKEHNVFYLYDPHPTSMKDSPT